MNNKIKTTIIYVLVLILVFSSTCFATAQTPPYVADYVECRLKVDGKMTDETAYTIKGNLYVSVEAVKKYGDTSKISIDLSEMKLLIDVSSLNLDMGDEQLSAYVKKNAGQCYIQIKSFESGNWVSIEPIAQILGLSASYEDGVISLSSLSNAENLAVISDAASQSASLSNETETSLLSGETVYLKKETKSFWLVENSKGESFYVNKDSVRTVSAEELPDFKFVTKEKTTAEKPINLVWNNLSEKATRSPLPVAGENGSPQQGVDVVSPPWLHQETNANGVVRHICDYGFVTLAHSLGYQVWITANNCFTVSGSTVYTAKVMESEELSDKVIAQYLFYAALYDADGINLDYEDLRKADRNSFASFCEKLGDYCHQMGLVFAVDTSIPTSYNTMYDWSRLGEAADYVVPMTYVEHMGSSVGSVSSYPWYSYYMNELAKYVPSEKILMGVPFFTRFYKLDSSGKIVMTSTLTMATALAKAKEHNAEIVWNDGDKQYVATWKEDGYTYKMWLEEETSIQQRIDYVKDAGLGGTACWAIEQVGEGILAQAGRKMKGVSDKAAEKAQGVPRFC